MTSTTSSIVTQAESIAREAAAESVLPNDGECLCCYVVRLLNDFPCDNTHRHSLRYRDIMAPRATALVSRLRRVGACCCDCELFLNGYWLTSWAEQYAALGYIEDDHGDAGFYPLPACAGVRRGSVQPCRHWERISW